MRKIGRAAAGVLAATAGLMTLGAPAFADSHDNDGVNAVDDNNINAVNIQLCGNEVAVIAVIADVLSPEANNCVNSPLLDHTGN